MTAANDLVEDSRRNRLLMFIGKFSEAFSKNEKQGKSTPAKEKLSGASLIKWENKNNERILNIARQLIWVAYDPDNNTLEAFDAHWQAIKDAEKALYGIKDRHLESEDVQTAQVQLDAAIEAFQSRMPAVFDPFAGGGAIPLEAARLGCRSYGNDLNPVAHIIERASVEFPQKYGKPIVYSKAQFEELYGTDAWAQLPKDQLVYSDSTASHVRIPNRLAFDVEHHANHVMAAVEEKIGQYYPEGPNGQKPIVYYWARVATCGNPSCKAEVPLLKQFYMVKKNNKKVHLKPVVNGTDISFEIQEGEYEAEGWNNRGNLICPCCGQATKIKQVKKQFKAGETKERLLAVIEDANSGKTYRLPTQKELNVVKEIPTDLKRPSSKMQVGNNRNFNTPGWGIDDYGQMFTDRQLLALNAFVKEVETLQTSLPDSPYHKALLTYLGIWVDRVALISTSFGRVHNKRETLEHPFSRQAIPMMFDFPELYPLSDSGGSAQNQLSWITRYIESESDYPTFGQLQNSSSGEIDQFPAKSISAAVTDPPYYDAIAYADLSDFFYVWLKRTLGEVHPLVLATPQTPKTEECTALKHHHNNKGEVAEQHFEQKLSDIFSAIERQTTGVVSIMFAHQTTKAWGTLCNSILESQMNLTGSWALDTEMANRSVGLSGDALQSSVTVVARPSKKEGIGDFQTVRRQIEARVAKEVEKLYKLGFRGADLLTACFGQAVSVFGEYERVERTDGTEITVEQLLELARETAFEALVHDIPESDDFTTFYIAWLNLFGFSEADHDDVRRITQVGLSVDVSELDSRHFIVEKKVKSKQIQVLAGFADRLEKNANIGKREDASTIDHIHRALHLIATNAPELDAHMNAVALDENGIFWRVLDALGEVVPPATDDHKVITDLISNKETYLKQAKTGTRSSAAGTQTSIEG
mgnify:CR=1 FL=1